MESQRKEGRIREGRCIRKLYIEIGREGMSGKRIT
mgnify:CR=1 FL=1